MENTLLNIEILTQLGFKVYNTKATERVIIMKKDEFEIVILDDNSIFYSNLGFYYPIKDLDALKKLYKEARREDLLTNQ
jgi:NACalpha-BTF3-like transcription factor